jgi:membrane dipeptidase
VLARLAGNGGLCMVTFVPKFVNQDVCDWTAEAKAAAAAEGIDTDDPEAEDTFLEAYRRAHPGPVASIADVVSHIEHVREVAGVEHIGLGGDYDGVGELPIGLEDVSSYPVLLAALAERGWSDEDLAGLTSRNVLRTMADAGLTAAGEAKQQAADPA